MPTTRTEPTIQCQLKLRLRPAQERMLDRWLWNLTAVWNWAIRKAEADQKAGIIYTAFDIKALLAGHSQRMRIPAHALQGTAATALDAWKRHRSGLSARPRLKGRRNRLNGIPFSQGRDMLIKDDRITIPSMGRVRFHRMEIPTGRVGSARLVKRASGWYLCLFIRTSPRPIPAVLNGQVGIDPGFSSLLTCSNGEVVDRPTEWDASVGRLGAAKRGSRSRLAARIHERVANRRKDRNHKLSRRLVSENAVICWSKDRSANLARLFGKSVTNAGHYQLQQMLSYKSRSGGRQFIPVPSRNSTRTCSACGALTGPTGFAGLSVRQWACACGATHDRDVNAAVNTLLAGLGMSLEHRREAVSGISN